MSAPSSFDLREAIGREYRREPALVEAAHIEAYASATDDTNPRFAGEHCVAPPIFPVRLFHGLMFDCVGDPDLGLDILRLVHGEQDMSWHGPLKPGDLLELTARLESVAQKTKGCVVAWRMVGSIEGEVRVEARFSVFVRGQMLPGVEPGAVFGDVPDGGGRPEGEPAMQATAEVDPSHPARYADASLDRNPIHLDESVAKAAGLPSVILHGLCTMAMATRGVVDELLGGDVSKLRRVAVRFSKPVLPGQRLTTTLHSAGSTDKEHKAYHLETRNQDGDAVISNGWVETSP